MTAFVSILIVKRNLYKKRTGIRRKSKCTFSSSGDLECEQDDCITTDINRIELNISISIKLLNLKNIQKYFSD